MRRRGTDRTAIDQYSSLVIRTMQTSVDSDDAPTTFVRSLFECETCQAHRLPLKTSSALYNAEEFKKDPSIQVRLYLKTWNYETAAIELYSNNQLFAVCPLNGERSSDSVERSNGSSRYFALKVQNETGKKSYLGISFKERTEAFDFISALQEWDERREKPSSKGGNVSLASDDVSHDTALSSLPLQNLSIKEGTKIKLSIKVAGKSTLSDSRNESDANIGTVSAGHGLAPPPSSMDAMGASLAPPPSTARGRQRGQRKTDT